MQSSNLGSSNLSISFDRNSLSKVYSATRVQAASAPAVEITDLPWSPRADVRLHTLSKLNNVIYVYWCIFLYIQVYIQ